mmetsp:Transcript_11574/g.17186  ORF Transcript_11574/g.17186 Transcript_11574/m.17186 type:complete len:240 (-) Transcript_11574:233-952(-)
MTVAKARSCFPTKGSSSPVQTRTFGLLVLTSSSLLLLLLSIPLTWLNLSTPSNTPWYVTNTFTDGTFILANSKIGCPPMQNPRAAICPASTPGCADKVSMAAWTRHFNSFLSPFTSGINIDFLTVSYLVLSDHAHPSLSPIMSAINTTHPFGKSSLSFTRESAFQRRNISCGPAPVWNKIKPGTEDSLFSIICDLRYMQPYRDVSSLLLHLYSIWLHVDVCFAVLSSASESQALRIASA